MAHFVFKSANKFTNNSIKMCLRYGHLALIY